MPPVRPPIIGRTAELAILTDWWEQARNGNGVLVGFVAAEAGGGKTTLLEEFATGLHTQSDGLMVPLVGWGQCIETANSGESYLPIIEALNSLCQGPHGDEVMAVLRRFAPSFPRPGTLTEFAAALTEVSAAYPLVLVLEDVHHADRSTIEMIDYLARRRSSADVLLLGTCRTDLMHRAHQLRAVVQDLAARGLCRRLALRPWSATDVDDYVKAWLAPRTGTSELVSGIAERTDGNPLFVAALCRHLEEGGLLITAGESVRATGRLDTLGVPEEVRLLLQRQVDDLDHVDRTLLAVAAAVGEEFAIEAVSAGLTGQCTVVEVEERCATLARQGSVLSLMEPIEWSDGTVTAQCRFIHRMYREVLYEELGPARRLQAHRAIGARLAAGYGSGIDSIALELAGHHEHGRNYPEAVADLTTAARVAMSRAAYSEAHGYLRHALPLLEQIPSGPERERLELQLRRTSVVAAGAVWGWRERQAIVDCLRLSELAVAHDDVSAQVTALLGLHNIAMVRGDGKAREDAAAEVLSLAQRTRDSTAGLIAHLLQCYIGSRVGDCAAMWEHARRILELAPGRADPELALVLGEEPAVAAHQLGAIGLWQLGYPDQARRHVTTALTQARTLAIPPDIARALWYAAVIHTLCGDAPQVAELATELVDLSVEHELHLWRAGGSVLGGWAAATLGDVEAGLPRLRAGVVGWAQFARLGITFHACVAADAFLGAGHLEEARSAVATGLAAVASDGERQSEPELLRLNGELLAASGEPERAEHELKRALALTRQRSARGFELRTATSLARLWRQQGRLAEAADLVTRIAGCFDEGQDTRDLRAAKAIVAV